MKGKLANVLLLLGTALCWAQVPPNDHFTNRTVVIGSSFTLTAEPAGATFDWDNEPGYNDDQVYMSLSGLPGASSLWWSWTPTQSSVVVIERTDEFSMLQGYLAVYATPQLTFGSRFDQVAGIYLPRPGQFAVFSAQAGTEYQISIASRETNALHFRFISTDAPLFRVQPASQTVSVDASTVFSALAIGIGPCRYQWRHAGLDMPNATNHMLALDHISSGDAGEYCAVVTSATGVNTSRVVRLVVTAEDGAPSLTALCNSRTGSFQFSVTGEAGRRYRIEYSSDLLAWGSPNPAGVIFNTNTTTSFQTERDTPVKFVRLSTYHSENEICVNRLRQIQTALRLSAEDNHLPDNAAIGPGSPILDSYLIDRKWPQCPLSPDDYPTLSIVDIGTPPACSIIPWSHILEEP